MNYFKSVVIGIIAVTVVATILSFTIRSADANSTGVWEYHKEVDEITDDEYHLLGADVSEDKWVVFGCGKSTIGNYWYYQRMQFGSFAFINSGERVDGMLVRYARNPARSDVGWSALEQDGSIATREFYSLQMFKAHINNFIPSQKVRYRVTSYDKDTFDIVFDAPSKSQFEHLLKKCDFN